MLVPWHRRQPAQTNYEIALDGAVSKVRRLSPTKSHRQRTPFAAYELDHTQRYADRCDACGATSFTTLQDGEHDLSCMRP